jgi:hypothetical protein
MIKLTKEYCSTAILSLALFMSSCNLLPEPTETSITPEPETVTYVISKGEQSSSGSSFKKVNTQKVKFEVTFDNSAIYSTTDPANQSDINKLYGLSDCGNHHHTNSARFGWRWYNNQLEIHAYSYIAASRHTEYITSIPLNKPAICELTLSNGKYIFNVNGKQVTLPRGCGGKMDAYKLYPYFGGDEVAPHDIKISIKELL